MWKWIMTNPLKSICAIVVRMPIMDAYLQRKATRELYWPVVNKLMQGSKPSTIPSAVRIAREDIDSYMCEMFLPDEWSDLKATRFGVIIGPSGSGKTSAARDLPMQ